MGSFLFKNRLIFIVYLPVFAYLKILYFRNSFHIAFFLILSISSTTAQSPIDSLSYSSVQERALLKLRDFVDVRFRDLDSALFYAEQGKKLALSIGDSLTVVRLENAIAWSYREKGLFDKSVEHYTIAIEMSKRNGFDDREQSLSNSLGILYYNYGEYDNALKYYFQSLNLSENRNNQSGQVIALNNIGLVYFAIRDFNQAIDYFEKTLELTGGETVNGIEAIVNLGLCYSSLDQHEVALEYYNKVISLCNNSCNMSVLTESYIGAASSHLISKSYEEAQINFEKALMISLSEGFERKTVIIYHNLADLKLINGLIDESLQTLDKSHGIAMRLNIRVWVNKNYRLYSKIYSKLDNYQQAYSFQEKYDSLNSLILNEEIIQNLAKVQIEFQERENLQTIASQDQEISRRTTLLILSVIIIFLISVILFILYRINQLRKKANQQLSEANAIIEQQNKELMDVNNVLEEKVKERTKELKDTNAALLKSNTDLDNFIYKTSHDIRGPLATLQGMCNIALMDIEEPKSVDYFEKIGRTADRLNEILSKLLVINQINNSLITSNPIDVKRLIKDILIEYQQSPGANKIRVDNQVERMDNFKSDEVLLKIILNNLISNAYKFYNSSNRVDSWIRIDASQCNNGHVEFNVIDNGIGIDEAAAGKIFEIFSKASEVSDSAGLGLYLVKLAVEKLDGTIAHSKTKEGYTQFKVELPHR